jgi:hypothetical protein
LLLTTILPSGLPDGLDDTRSVRLDISVYWSCLRLVSMNNHRRIMCLDHPTTRDGYNIIFHSQWIIIHIFCRTGFESYIHVSPNQRLEQIPTIVSLNLVSILSFFNKEIIKKKKKKN